MSKYTCRNCTSAKVSCPFCASIVRYDGIRSHVKRQHPDVDIPKGFTINLTVRWQSMAKHGQSPIREPASQMTGSPSADPRSTKLPLRGSAELVPRSVISQTGESCSCKYYNFLSFLINNGINVEKIKENINLLKSIDNLK